MGKKKKTLAGYYYYLGMHLVICHSADSIERIDVGEKTIQAVPITTNGTYIVFWPELFGGYLKEGGVAGAFDILFGAPTQVKNDYLMSQLGPVIPAFRGVISVVLRQMYLTAMSPYIKLWQFVVKRIPGKAWYPAKADIGGGSANAAHIIYDCFTNPSWGMGYPESVLDLQSLRDCADTLYAEGLGLSFILSNTDSLESFMQEVCKHVAATLYTDAVTGKFKMMLLRNDYNVALLNVYDESNIITLQSYEKPSPAEMVNEVVVKYRPRGTGKDDSVTVQDLASIQSQGGVISQTLDYAGLDNQTNAGRIAARELRTRSTPLTRVKFLANRSAWKEKIGGVIKFTWAAHGVTNMVLRIVNINFGTLEKGEIQIVAIEDVFGLPFAQYLAPQPSQWTDPVQPPAPLTQRNVMEATFWDVTNNLNAADTASLSTAASFLLGAAGQPTQATPNFEFWTKPGGGSYVYADTQAYCPYALTTAGANQIQTTIAIGSIRGDMTTVAAGSYAQWGTELIRFDSYNSGTGIITIGRGVLDTVPTTHATNTRIMFLEDYQAADKTMYAQGETVSGRLLMRTSSSLLPLTSAPEDSVVMQGRFSRPYPPARLTLNTQRYPSALTDPLVIAWRSRNRLQQLATLIDQEAANVTAEAGTTYIIRVYNDTLNALLREELNWPTLTYTPAMPAGMYACRVEVSAVRAGIESYQKQVHIFLFTKATDNRIIESGDTRITEDGDNRITE